MGSRPVITRTLEEIARLCGATLEGDGARVVVGPASLAEATEREVSFLGNPRYASQLEETAAAAVIVPLGVRTRRSDLALLRCENPNRAFTDVIEAFRPREDRLPVGVHPSAVVEEGARLGEGVRIGPFVHVGRGAEVGARSVLHDRVSVGPRCRIGEDCTLHPGVVLYDGTELGDRCSVHAGSVLGSDGFGYEPTAEGWEKVPQCGSVLLEDDVEVGANCAIDRGRFAPTRILRGTKIDNLVHVAHNVVVGPEALLIAQVGISGSARLGRRVIIAGQAGVNGHVTIADGVRVGGGAGVVDDLPEPGDYWGFPAIKKTEAARAMLMARRLPDLFTRLKRLERRMAEAAPGGAPSAGAEPAGHPTQGGD